MQEMFFSLNTEQSSATLSWWQQKNQARGKRATDKESTAHEKKHDQITASVRLLRCKQSRPLHPHSRQMPNLAGRLRRLLRCWPTYIRLRHAVPGAGCRSQAAHLPAHPLCLPFSHGEYVHILPTARACLYACHASRSLKKCNRRTFFSLRACCQFADRLRTRSAEK